MLSRLIAGDEVAVQDEIPLICRCLCVVLSYHLHAEPDWPDHEDDRWFDDIMQLQCEFEFAGRVKIAGSMVWGLLSKPGPQWAEPFSADIAISETWTEIADYCLRFGRRDDDTNQELPFGFYPTFANREQSPFDPWEGRADWKFEFRSVVPPRGGALPSPT